MEPFCQLVSKTIADLAPQLDEGLASLNVDVRFLGQEVSHYLDTSGFFSLTRAMA
jgi:hypothetical protein